MDNAYLDITKLSNALNESMLESNESMLESIPDGSNSFYNFSNIDTEGMLNLYKVDGRILPYSFMVYSEHGSIHTGENTFCISRNEGSLYGTLTLKPDTELIVDNAINFDNAISEIHGTVRLLAGTKIIASNSSSVIFYSDSTLEIDLNDYYQNDTTHPPIEVGEGTEFKIYGEINIKLPQDTSMDFNTRLAAADSIINNESIYIDSAARINIELDFDQRETSLTDYEYLLRDKVINIHTQGETNTHTGRIGYVWKSGSIADRSQIIRLNVLWGEVVLGDFKLSVLGRQTVEMPNLQIIESIHVMKGTTLHISERFGYNGIEYQYVRPELYLGRVIDNCANPGYAIIDGNVIVDGPTALLTLDRSGNLTIGESGRVELKNGAVMRSAYNTNQPVLFINGILVIDYIEQLIGFTSDNIVFGEKGKLIILNPPSDEYRLLWSTPNGIKNSKLYNLFENVLDHVEYHISANTGIKIDQYYDFFGRDMKEWYNGMRIEKAIHEGLIVWHDGGCIELDHNIIPWITQDSSLMEMSRIFKSYGSYDKDRLQEVVSRLKYAGSGDINFRIIYNNDENEMECKTMTLCLKGTSVKSVVNKPNTDSYEVTADGPGDVFIRNMISDVESVVSEDSLRKTIIEGTTEFSLS